MAGNTKTATYSSVASTERSTKRLGFMQLGRLLCWLGLHRYQWRSIYGYDAYDNRVEYDQYKCKRPDCSHSKVWVTVNVERKPW